MLRSRSLYAALGVLLLAVPSAWSQSEPLLDEPTGFALRGEPGPTPDRPDCRLITLSKGAISGFGYADPEFTGEDLVIWNTEDWLAFWNEHVALLDPPPPAPAVDFQRHAVIAVVQGRQSSGGGPNIAIWHFLTPGNRIIVFDDERPGPLDVITNPFHIVLVDRRCLRLAPQFVHIAPRPGSAVLMGRVAGAGPSLEPRPLAGARVTLRSLGAAAPPRVAYTGLDGSYFFVNLSPGAYSVRAEKPGFALAEEPVVLPEDGRVHKDFVLTALPPPPPGRISGFITGAAPSGPQPLSGATVTLARPHGPIAATQSGPDGAYEFPGLPPGEYWLRVSKDGYQPATAQVTLPPGGEVQRDFLLQPVAPPVGGVLAGVVRASAPTGELFPLPGAKVRVRLPSGTVRDAVTNAQGQYAIPGLPAGTYTAVATKAGFRPAEAVVTIVAGQVTQCDFVLQPIQTPLTGGLVGFVRTAGPDGELVPLPGARVRVVLPGGQFRESLTNLQGRYAIPGLPAGVFTARASKPGFVPAEAQVTIVAGEATVQDFVLTAAPALVLPSPTAHDAVRLDAAATPR